MARIGHIPPVIVLTKAGLITPEDLAWEIAAISHDGIPAEVRALSGAAASPTATTPGNPVV
jgi:hypothetical protein